MLDSTHHWLGLEGRVCVVTGAASGIGAAIARRPGRRRRAASRCSTANGDACEQVAAGSRAQRRRRHRP